MLEEQAFGSWSAGETTSAFTPLNYKAKRLSSVRSAFLRLLLAVLAGALSSPVEGNGKALSEALARSSRNLSKSRKQKTDVTKQNPHQI